MALLFSEKEAALLEDSDSDDDSPPPPSSNEKKKRFDPIATATIDDVEFTLESINPHKRINPKKPRNKEDYLYWFYHFIGLEG